ncbi:MAG: Gfo/Idh/MocA family oxidoreductase [Pseudolysinimonas sp.]|uniref:Gfo/Idh/MocA family protein n=1 Tax=Pseudolysinimonas sp. TaxID=2680009 RepID=UPI003C722CE8
MAGQVASPEPIRTAIVGFGVSGRVFHAPFIATHPSYSLDVIVTADPGRAGEAKLLHPAASVVRDVDAVLTRAADLDLLVVATPPASHHAIAAAALEAGLDVVVDKPFAVSAAAARDLTDRAQQLGRLLTVFQNRRWDGDFLTVRRLIDAGDLGEVRRFESRFEWFKPQPRPGWKSESSAAEGGGILFDLGAHLIDQALQLFGPAAEVYSELATNRTGGMADDDAFVALRHNSGVISHLWMNSITPQFGPRFRVLGSAAGFTTWGLDGQEAHLRAGGSPEDDTYGITEEARWGLLGVEGAVAPYPTAHGDYGAFYRGLVAAIREGAPPPVDPVDPTLVLDLIDRIHEGRP